MARALRIARAFTDARPEWTLADLSRELRLSKPTAFRLLGALEDGGLVTRSGAAGNFRYLSFTLAHESRKPTVRLNARAPSRESTGSLMK